MGTLLNLIIFFSAQIPVHWGYAVNIAKDLSREEVVDFFFFSCFSFLEGLEQKKH